MPSEITRHHEPATNIIDQAPVAKNRNYRDSCMKIRFNAVLVGLGIHRIGKLLSFGVSVSNSLKKSPKDIKPKTIPTITSTIPIQSKK